MDYVGFRSAGYDLGTAVQAIWNTAHGRLLETTAVNGAQFPRLGWHVDPLLVLFAPVWLIWSSPVILVVVLAAAVSAGALPVYWLAQKHLRSDGAAMCFALAYLAYPATQWQALDPNLGFNPVSLALPLLLYALWWLDEERWVRFGAVALLAAASNEHIPLIVGCLGLWYGVTRRRPVVGAAMFAAGLAVTAVSFLYVVPHFSPTGSNPFADRYAAVGSTTPGVLKTILLHSLKAADVLLTGHKLAYLALLFVPLLGLASARRCSSSEPYRRSRSTSCRPRKTRARSRVTTRRRPPPFSSGRRSSAPLGPPIPNGSRALAWRPLDWSP